MYDISGTPQLLLPLADSICRVSRLRELDRVDHSGHLRVRGWELFLACCAYHTDGGFPFVLLCVNTAWFANCEFGDLLRLRL